MTLSGIVHDSMPRGLASTMSADIAGTVRAGIRRVGSLPCFLAVLFVLVAGSVSPAPAQSQAQSPASAFEARLADTERALVEKEQRLKRFPAAKRKALVEFVIGNMLFVSAHELGHGVLAEFELPNLGHDEDAADNFAILTALKIGTGFSERVLVEATKGWYLADLRDKATGEKPEYYGAHSMNLQRAYQIVCMMVGAQPEKFKEMADITKMPEDRQRSCKTDFTFTALSWETLLKPHQRAPDRPKQQIEIIYGDAKGDLAIFAKTFRDIRFLEAFADAMGEHYAWPKPFSMEMAECGEVGANWRARKFKICYEMAQEFAQLYRDYGDKLKAATTPAKKKKRTAARR